MLFFVSISQVWYAAHYAERIGVAVHEMSETDLEGIYIYLSEVVQYTFTILKHIYI